MKFGAYLKRLALAAKRTVTAAGRPIWLKDVCVQDRLMAHVILTQKGIVLHQERSLPGIQTAVSLVHMDE